MLMRDAVWDCRLHAGRHHRLVTHALGLGGPGEGTGLDGGLGEQGRHFRYWFGSGSDLRCAKYPQLGHFYEDPPHDISYGIPKCTDRLHAIEPPRLYAVATARGCRVVCFTLPTASVREPQVCSNVAAVTFCTKDPLRHRIEILIPSPGCSEQFVTC